MITSADINKPRLITFAIIFFLAFIDWMGVGLVYPMFSALFFESENSIFLAEKSETIKGFWLGLLLAIMPLTQFFSSPILGAWSDKKGRKPVLIFSLLLGFIGYLISTLGIWSSNLWITIFGRMLVGIAAGNVAVAASVLTDLYPNQTNVKSFGLLHMAAGIGFTLGPFLGGILSKQGILGISGFDKPFLFAASLTLINLILLFLFFNETNLNRSIKPLKKSLSLSNIRKIFSSKELKYLIVCVFIFRFGWAFYWEFIPVVWIKDYGLSTSNVGNLYAFSAGFYALSCGILIRPLVQRIKPILLFFLALVLTGAAVLSSCFFHSMSYLFYFLAMQQYLTAFLFPVATAIFASWVKDDSKGEALGIFQSIEAIAFGISPLISGCLVGLHHKTPIILGGISMLIASIVLVKGCSSKIFSKADEVL